MRYVVTGAGGLLGAALVNEARSAGHEVIPVYHRQGDGGLRLDLRTTDAPARLVERSPDWIIHCAANVDVDWCETHPTEALLINATVPSRLAEAAAEANIGMVQISTDSVFDGARGRYREGDLPNPLNVYAACKYEAEGAVVAASRAHLVVRTNIFGLAPGRRPSLAEWIIGRLRDHQPVPGFTDVRFSPLYVRDLSRVILRVIEHRASGLYHAGSRDAMSKYEFARTLAVASGFDARLVQPASSEDANFLAKRPKNTSLDSSLLTELLAERLPSIAEGIDRLIRHTSKQPAVSTRKVNS